MKHVLKFLVLASIWTAGRALAVTVTVNQPLPSTQYLVGTAGNGVYYAAGSGGILFSSNFVNVSQGFRVIDTDTAGADPNLIYVDVSVDAAPTVSSGQQLVVILYAGTATSGNEIAIRGASAATYTNGIPNSPILCNSTGTTTCLTGTRQPGTTTVNLGAVFAPGTVLRVSFALTDLCGYTNPGVTSGAPAPSSTAICNGIAINEPQNSTQSLSIVAAIATATGNTLPTTAGSATATFSFGLTDVGPTINKPSSGNIEDFYHPGANSCIFNPGNYALTTGNGSPLQSFVVFASESNTIPVITTNSALPAAGEVQSFLNFSGDRQPAYRFNNTTTIGTGGTPNPDHGYTAAIYGMNVAGIFSSTPVQAPTDFPKGQGDVSYDGKLHAEQINSVLTKSKCFIATAAFHDGDAAPVLMLRKFRDLVLAKSSAGRSFISTYYHYSPAVAEWAWDKPIIRSIALHALAPIEFMAWAWMKITHAAQVDSPQPYIDRIKKKLDEEDAAALKAGASPAPTSDESYIESVKKKLGPTPAPESYSEKIKKTLPPQEDPSQDYSNKIKADLPPEEDTESEIAKVKAGRDKPPVLKRGAITSAAGFKLGVAPGVKVSNDDPQAAGFSEMYGSGWQPDLMLHFERQLFHSENFGSFGIGADLGISYAEGFGIYQFGFGSTNSKKSVTKFSFVQLPVLLDVIYRFNLFRLVRPYIGVGAGAMLYTEVRTDGQPSRNGYTPVYEGMVGASFLLDPFDRKTSLDSYLSEGLQHSYLFLEYMLMKSFSKTGVTFERGGAYLGFLFEY